MCTARPPKKLLLQELEQGRLHLVLHGAKLRGRFALIKLQRGKGNEWLLLKQRDAFAGDKDVLAEDLSALSGRPMEKIAGEATGRGDVWHSNKGQARRHAHKPAKVPALDADEAPAAAMPHKIKPMLATLVDEPFDRPGWWYEVKWDGYRAIAEVEGAKVRLYSRNFISFEGRIRPGRAGAEPARPRRGAGRRGGGPGRVGPITISAPAKLSEDGRGDAGLLRLRSALSGRQGPAPAAPGTTQGDPGAAAARAPRPAPERARRGARRGLFRRGAAQGLEGIIAKKADSPYRQGRRSPDWLKIKTRKQQEAVIGGFTRPRGSRKDLGALVLGVYEGDDLVYIGHAGTGFDTKGLRDVREKLEPLVRKTAPSRRSRRSTRRCAGSSR